jgi:hypothetical protein
MKTPIRFTTTLLLAISTFYWTGCASIVSGRHKNVNFVSNPSGAKFTILDEKGEDVAVGVTPQTVNLRTGRAYFGTKKYTIRFERDGHAPEEVVLKSKFNGWYIGNILFGGLVGLLIVDPLTGAVYTLHKEMVVDLAQLPEESVREAGLRITNLSALPESLKQSLVRVD